jgi:hypothetical protein
MGENTRFAVGAKAKKVIVTESVGAVFPATILSVFTKSSLVPRADVGFRLHMSKLALCVKKK